MTFSSGERGGPGPQGMLRRAAFLDRDGTLIHDPGYLGDPARVVLLPGAAAAAALLNRAGYVVVVVTNQSGVGRGYFDEAAVHAVHARLGVLLLAEDPAARIAAYYHCPHQDRDCCSCRKPLPGLLLRAAADLGLDLPGSLCIGDAGRDVLAGLAAGCGRALQVGPEQPAVPTLLDGVRRLLELDGPPGQTGSPAKIPGRP